MGTGQQARVVRRQLIGAAVTVVLALVVLAVVPGRSAGAGRAAVADPAGKATFDSLCAGCHTIGGGKKVGPDLAGLPSRSKLEWVRQFILVPDKVIAAGDPIAKRLLSEYSNVPMPNLGVTDAQIGPLLAYLDFSQDPAITTEPAPATTATAPQPTVVAGDAARGKNLFEGGARLSAGGPACLSCHAVSGAGTLGGGALGPDLTGSYAKYGGEQGLSSALKTVSFPTMAPIFSRKPLTSSEIGDLAAFLKTAPVLDRPPGAAAKLVGFSIAVVGVLTLLAMAVWRRRLLGVRKPLVNRSRGK